MFFSSVVLSQEIGSIHEGGHFIKLHKLDNLFSFTYSDAETINFKKEHSFSFSDKNNFYSILIDGFKNSKSHQIILQIGNDTIVKLNYKKNKGELLLYVYQNNLKSKISGRSTFFTKKQITNLFGIEPKV
jgi:hypothetical protein